MENLLLTVWQTAVLALLYIAYLGWVLFGGMRRRKIKPVVYIVMTALMLYGVIREFTGVHTAAELIDLILVLAVGFFKGIVLGRRKFVEKIDGIWYMHHDGKYILLWLAFFGVKLLLTQLLKLTTGAQFPLWHMIVYFCFYYPWRTIQVFLRHPDMRKEIFSKSH